MCFSNPLQAFDRDGCTSSENCIRTSKVPNIIEYVNFASPHFPELCASNEIDNFGFVSNLLFCEMNECKRLLGTLEYLPCFPMMAK